MVLFSTPLVEVDDIGQTNILKKSGVNPGEPIFLTGINKQLSDWISSKDSVLYDKLTDADLAVDDFKFILSTGRYEHRVDVSINICEKLWWAHPELGNPLLFRILNEMEYQNSSKGDGMFSDKYVFYSNYRDHVMHSLYVFLIGLYLYDHISCIKKVIDEYYKNSGFDAFYKTWLVAAVYHDTGYIFESWLLDHNDVAAKNRIKDVMNKIRLDLNPANPLNNTKPNKKAKLTKLFQDRLSNNDIKPPPNLGSDDKKDCLDRIVSCLLDCKAISQEGYDEWKAKKTNTTENPKNPLREAYKIKKQIYMGGTFPMLWDHGITSAILLCHLHDLFYDFWINIKDICGGEKAIYKGEIKKTSQIFIKTQTEVENTIIPAACAIALHNLETAEDDAPEDDITFEMVHQLLSADFDLEEIDLSLSGEAVKVPPVAGLLKVSDVLHNWDRKFYRKFKTSDLGKNQDSFDMVFKPVQNSQEKTVKIMFRKDGGLSGKINGHNGALVNKFKKALKNNFFKDEEINRIFNFDYSGEEIQAFYKEGSSPFKDADREASQPETMVQSTTSKAISMALDDAQKTACGRKGQCPLMSPGVELSFDTISLGDLLSNWGQISRYTSPIIIKLKAILDTLDLINKSSKNVNEEDELYSPTIHIGKHFIDLRDNKDAISNNLLIFIGALLEKGGGLTEWKTSQSLLDEFIKRYEEFCDKRGGDDYEQFKRKTIQWIKTMHWDIPSLIQCLNSLNTLLAQKCKKLMANSQDRAMLEHGIKNGTSEQLRAVITELAGKFRA